MDYTITSGQARHTEQDTRTRTFIPGVSHTLNKNNALKIFFFFLRVLDDILPAHRICSGGS